MIVIETIEQIAEKYPALVGTLIGGAISSYTAYLIFNRSSKTDEKKMLEESIAILDKNIFTMDHAILSALIRNSQAAGEHWSLYTELEKHISDVNISVGATRLRTTNKYILQSLRGIEVINLSLSRSIFAIFNSPFSEQKMDLIQPTKDYRDTIRYLMYHMVLHYKAQGSILKRIATKRKFKSQISKANQWISSHKDEEIRLQTLNNLTPETNKTKNNAP